MLIVFGGLPGVGKTALSRETARRLGLAWLRIDAIEAAMWRAGLPPGDTTGIGAYAVAHTVAAAQLGLGHSVVVDAVNPVEAARQGWRALADSTGTDLRVIEVVCSDADEHRRRVEQREAQEDQPAVLTWDEVLGWEYEPWAEERLTVDAAGDVDECLAKILAYCGLPGAPQVAATSL